MAILILAIVLAMAVPSVNNWLLNAQIRTTAESMLDGLQKARTEAVKRNTYVEFQLNVADDGGWTIRIPNTVPAEVVETRNPQEGTGKTVIRRYIGAVLTPSSKITFDGKGRRWANFDATSPVNRVCVNSTILSAANSRNLEIDISSSGEIRMCDPQVSTTTDNRYCLGYPTPCTD